MKYLKKNMLKIMVCVLLLLVGVLSFKGEVHAQGRTTLQIGKTYSGEINKNNISDEYILNLRESGRISFIINVDDAETLYVYDKNGNKLSPYFFFGYGQESATLNLKAGKYTLELHRYGYCDSSYTFTTKFTSAKETFAYKNEFISDVSSKSAIPYRTTVNCQLAMDETYDYYKINVPSQGNLTFNLSTNISQAEFSIVNGSGRKIDEFYGYSNERNYSKRYSLKKGTYYLKVERCASFLGTYSFKVFFSKDAIASFVAKKASKKSMIVTAKKAGAISGYQIKYRKSNGSWKTKNINKSNALKTTINKLSKGSKYKVKIRTYYTYKGKKLYSNWSKTKTVNLK